ncbi:ArsR/SmtB family transcription factor [Streptococcus sp. FT1-106]|uniref:ArsR/SmtB family transcription factor n=1 Tax=unclassified Streptococcus TaxID=2608887 RepID=UPI003BF5A22D
MSGIKDFSTDAQLFRVLADEKRLLILDYLKNGETCACVLIERLGIAQSALSYHMKILCQSGIVVSRQEGKWKHYSLNYQGSNYALHRLAQLTNFEVESIGQCHCNRKSS